MLTNDKSQAHGIYQHHDTIFSSKASNKSSNIFCYSSQKHYIRHVRRKGRNDTKFHSCLLRTFYGSPTDILRLFYGYSTDYTRRNAQKTRKETVENPQKTRRKTYSESAKSQQHKEFVIKMRYVTLSPLEKVIILRTVQKSAYTLLHSMRKYCFLLSRTHQFAHYISYNRYQKDR